MRRGANEDAEDLVQETYLRLLRAHQDQGEAIANPEAYLYTVALNLAREQAARRKQAPLRIDEMEQFSQRWPQATTWKTPRTGSSASNACRPCWPRCRSAPARYW